MADVNYGGSTGYGREFRNRLQGSWGIVDVDDCRSACALLPPLQTQATTFLYLPFTSQPCLPK